MLQPVFRDHSGMPVLHPTRPEKTAITRPSPVGCANSTTKRSRKIPYQILNALSAATSMRARSSSGTSGGLCRWLSMFAQLRVPRQSAASSRHPASVGKATLRPALLPCASAFFERGSQPVFSIRILPIQHPIGSTAGSGLHRCATHGTSPFLQPIRDHWMPCALRPQASDRPAWMRPRMDFPRSRSVR